MEIWIATFVLMALFGISLKLCHSKLCELEHERQYVREVLDHRLKDISVMHNEILEVIREINKYTDIYLKPLVIDFSVFEAKLTKILEAPPSVIPESVIANLKTVIDDLSKSISKTDRLLSVYSTNDVVYESAQAMAAMDYAELMKTYNQFRDACRNFENVLK